MNELSDSSKENYIQKMMKRYEFISKISNYYVKNSKNFFKNKIYFYCEIIRNIIIFPSLFIQ